MSEYRVQYDVIVAGGGSAGTFAAIAAARRGAKVLLVEELNALGGVSTSAMVNEWFSHFEGLGNIFDYIREEMVKFGTFIDGDAFKYRHFNGEHLKLVLQLLCEKSGVDVLFHASVLGAESESGKVKKIKVACLSKVLEFEGKYFIDTTGEGDLAWLAGAQYMKGNEQGQTLNMTLMGMLYNTGMPVNTYLPEGLEKIEDPSELHSGLNGIWQISENRVMCNMVKIQQHDPLDPFSLSHAEMEARREFFRMLDYWQRNGFETYQVMCTGATIGIREGRRIQGDYVITEKDIIEDNGYRDGCGDAVACVTSQTDYHSLTRKGDIGYRREVVPYPIPIRSLIAKGYSNLGMAGKCASADQVVHSSYRQTPTCYMMGQAIGTAFGMAVEKGLDDIRKLDIEELQNVLREDGMELNYKNHKPFVISEDPWREGIK